MRKLMKEDEWSDSTEQDRNKRGPHALRQEAEFRAVDMPSSRGVGWRSLQIREGTQDDTAIRTKAMDIQLRLVVARMDEALGQIRTKIVDQANMFLQKIRSTGSSAAKGYNLKNAAYEEVQAQGRAVRLQAQIYNICRAKLKKLAWGMTPEAIARAKDLLNRYCELKSEDLVCSTQTYSTRGTSSNFQLPWFWRMVPLNFDETPEQTREKDELFVAECKFCIALEVYHTYRLNQSSVSAG